MSQVQVCVRVRPLNDTEEENEYRNVIKVPPGPPDGQLFITKPAKYLSVAEQQEKIKKREIGSNFQFDRVFDSTDENSPHHSNQQTVFDYIGRKVVSTAFNAFNCTVFAYGQTGSGKTYTLMGYPEEEERGLVPRTCEHLFQEIQRVNEENPEDTFARFKVEISFLEIYNEKVRDLLLRQQTPTTDTQQQTGNRSRASAAKQALRVREHPKEGVIVEGLSRHIVNDYDAVEEFLRKGNAVRVSGATHVHEQSSRSHAIFTIHFVQAEMSEDGIPNERVSKINLVDLAGSERADPSSDYNKERFKEGININKSLVSLGNVIDSLAELSSQQSGSRPNTSASSKGNKGDSNQQQHNIHVPYRESVLTFLLRDSLGGNAFTTMIATISPSSGVYSETISTLRYASRTQVIKNQPIKNEDPQIKLIKDLKSQVDRLKQMLEQKGGLDGVSQVLEEKMQEGQEQIDSLTEQWTQQWERQKLLLQDSVTHDTTGLTVNSDFPHLVGFPNTSTRSKAFVVYQLCPGSFSIGSGNHEIGISGTPSHQAQGVIKNENGVITLTPNKKSHEFQINSVDISGTSHLYNGCLVQLGKNNLFRFWDPAVLKTRQNAPNINTENEDGGVGGDSDQPPIDSDLTDENAYLAPPPQFSRLRGLDRAASVMSFQSVDMEESLYGGMAGDLGGGGLRGRGNFAPSERTQSMASLLSNQEVIQKIALADSLAEQLNEANKQIEDMREQRQYKDAQDEDRRIALENLQFDYQEQICEHQEKIDQLLIDNENMVQKAEAEIAHLQQKLDDKREKEKAKLDEEIQKIDKQMQQVHARKKTAKTTMAKSNLEKEEIEVMGKLRNLREREKKLKESLKATENQIRDKEKKVAAKKKKYEEKFQKMQSELHTIKAQYLDRHMRTSLANKNSASRDQINHFSEQKLDDLNNENEEMNPGEVLESKPTDVNGHEVQLRSKRGRSNNEVNRHAISGLVLPNKSSFSELLERRKRERDAAAAAQMPGGLDNSEAVEVKGGRPQSKMIDVAIGEDDEGNPMYLKISLRGSRENLEDQEQSSTSHKDQQPHISRSQGRSIAKERALSMDLADLHKLTNFQELEIKEPNQYESGDNLLQMPSEYGRNIMLQRFMNDLGRASVSDVRSNFGQSHEKLPTSNSEINLKIERHCEAGVHVVSPNSSCETLQLEKPIKAKVVYHKSDLRVDSHLHIVQPLNMVEKDKDKQIDRGRKFSDYGSISSMTRGTSPTTFTSGDSVLGRQASDEKKVLRRVINGPHGIRPVSQELTAYPAFNGREGGNQRPKSLYSTLEFDDENQENEWGFQPLSSAQSGIIRRPFEIKQAEGHTAQIGPKVTLTVTPQVTVTAIPGHMLADRPNLIPKPGGDAQSPSGSSKFLTLRREMQSKQRQKPTDVSQSSIRSNLQSYSVIASREDLKEANDSHLSRRLYSNQPFLAESAISDDSPGGREVIADSTEMWANRASRQKRSRQQLHLQTPNSNSSLNQAHHLFASTPGENDLEVAHFGAPQYQPSPLIAHSSPPVDTNVVVRRKVNPNRSKRFEEKRMSWPVNKRDQLTAEMESQPLFIPNYQQSEDSISVFPADFTQDSPYDPVIIEDYEPVDTARQFEVPNRNANTNDVIVRNPPTVHYNNDRSFTDSRGDNATGTGTGTETEPYDENPYSMGIYIETKGRDGDDNNPPVTQFRKIEPEHFRFPSVSRPGMDQDLQEMNRSQGGSNYNLSRATSDVFSNFSGRNLISESSGTYRHIEEVFTTESIITKGNEKKTKAGKILGKWRLIRKKEKRAQEQEKFLSTLETSVNQSGSGKKIKFDKSLSASATSIGSVKKLRNQASSPIEFDDKTRNKRKQVSYLTVMHDRELSYTRLNRTDLEQSPKTPTSNTSTQTACEAATQTIYSPRIGKSSEYLYESRRRTSRISRKSRHKRKGKNLQSEGTQAGVYSSGSGDSGRTSSSSSGSSSAGGKKSKKGKFSRYLGRHGRGSKYGHKGRKYGSKRHNRDSVTSSNSKSSNEDYKKVNKSPNKRLKDAMTNTVNEIGIQTEAELQAVATNTELKEGTSDEIEMLLRGRPSDFNIVDYLNEAALSSESVQTLTFKSTPAAFNRDNKDKIPIARDRPVSLENIPSMRINDKLLRPPSRRKITKRLIDDKKKIYEFLMSLDSVKVEEYLQMLTAAGIARDVLQGLLQALQNKTPDSIPNEVLRYFDTESSENQSSNLNRGDIFRGHVDETSLTNITSFATFSTYLSIAEDILSKNPNVSESDKKQVLEALRKQDSSMIPKTLNPKVLQDIENAAASLLNDEQHQDTDTTSIIDSEYLSGPEFKRAPSKDARPNLLSPFGPRDSNQPSQNSTSRSPLNDSSQSRDNDQRGGSSHESKKSRIERLKQRSRTAGALDAFTTHSPMQSPIRPNHDMEDEIKESLINDEDQLNQNPDIIFPNSFSIDSRRTSNTSEAMAEIIGKTGSKPSDKGNRGTITSTPVDRELYRMSSDEALQDGSSPPTLLPVTGPDIAALPKDVRNKLAAQILMDQDNLTSRRQILSDAGASYDTASIVTALTSGNGAPSDIRDTIAQVLSDPVVQYILDHSEPHKCQETLSRIPIPIIANEDTSCDNFSEEMRSDESVAKQLKAAQGHHVSAVIFLASHALMNLPKGERNYWLEKLGLYDVIKDEIKDAIAKGDIEKLRKLLPEECAKFLLENLPGKRIKENISNILQQSDSPLHQHLVGFVAQALIEEPLELTSEMLSAVLENDEETESQLLQAIHDKDEAKIQSLLTNEVIDAIIGEVSSEVIVESLVNDDQFILEADPNANQPLGDLAKKDDLSRPSRQNKNEPKADRSNQQDDLARSSKKDKNEPKADRSNRQDDLARPSKKDKNEQKADRSNRQDDLARSSKKKGKESKDDRSNQKSRRKNDKEPDQKTVDNNSKRDQRSLPKQSFLSDSGNKVMAEIESSEPYLDNATSDDELENKEKSESDIQRQSGAAMMTPQRIVASLMLDWNGEKILEFISDFDNDRQNQILDAVIGGDIAEVASLIEKPMADKVLKEFNPFDIISVIEKAQDRFKDPAKLLDPENLEETKDVLQTLVETFKNDKSSLKDVLARLDVDLATKIFDSLNTGDLIATKALLHSAAKTSESSNLTKYQALSDSALARNIRPRKLSQTLFSKSESELAMKPQGSTTVSKEVLGDFYEEAQKLGSQSKIVYVNVPEPPPEIDAMPPGKTAEVLDLPEPADLDIPDELVDILSKYVHPDDVIGLYDAFLTNPELISENLPPDDVEKLYEEVKAYDEKRLQRMADLYNVAADTLKSLFPQEMDDLVEKMQQSMPEDVNTFCDHVKNGEFEQAAKYLPKDILDEMMDHNQSLLAEQIGDPPRKLVPAITEEDENLSDYVNHDPTANTLGILKKEEPQNNSAKNLHQVKFASEVLEFNLTNPSLSETFESNNSSKDSLITGEKQNGNLEDEGNIDDGLNNALSDLEKDFDDIGEKISALEARMSENDKPLENSGDNNGNDNNDNDNGNNGEPVGKLLPTDVVEPRHEIRDEMPEVENRDLPASKIRPWKKLADRSPPKKLKPLDYAEIEDGDIIPEMRERRGLEHIPTDLDTLFAPGDEKTEAPSQSGRNGDPTTKRLSGFPPGRQDSRDESGDDDGNSEEDDSVGKEEERGDLMRDIDKWEQNQLNPVQTSPQPDASKSSPTSNYSNDKPTLSSTSKPSKIPKLQSPRSPKDKKPTPLDAKPLGDSPKMRKYNQLGDNNELPSNPVQNDESPRLDEKVSPSEPKSPPSKIPRRTSPRVPVDERIGMPLKRFDSKIDEDLVPAVRTGQQEKENDRKFDELFDESEDEGNGSTTENEEIITSPTRDRKKPDLNSAKEIRTPVTPRNHKDDNSKKRLPVSEKIPPKNLDTSADKIHDSLPDKSEQGNKIKPTATNEPPNKQSPIWRAPISGSPKRPGDLTEKQRDNKTDRLRMVNLGDSSSLELSLETETIPRQDNEQPREGSPTPQSGSDPEDLQKSTGPNSEQTPELNEPRRLAHDSPRSKRDPSEVEDPNDQSSKPILNEMGPSSSSDSPRSIDSSIDLGKPDRKEDLSSKPLLRERNLASPPSSNESLNKKLPLGSKNSRTDPKFPATPKPVENDKKTTQKVPPLKFRKPFLPPRQNHLVETPEPLQTSSPIQTPVDENFLKPEQVEKPQSTNKDQRKNSKPFPWEPTKPTGRAHQQISDENIETEERPQNYSAMPITSEPNKFFPKSESPRNRLNVSEPPERGKEPGSMKKPVEPFIDPDDLRETVADIWPKGKEPDTGYITVKDTDVRVQATAKPNVGENPKFSKPKPYKPETETLTVTDNEPKLAEAITQVVQNPFNKNELIERPEKPLPVDEEDEDFIPSSIQNQQEKEPDFTFMNKEPIPFEEEPKIPSDLRHDIKQPREDEPLSNRPERPLSSENLADAQPIESSYPSFQDWPPSQESEAPTGLPYPVEFNGYPNPEFPTSATPQTYPADEAQPFKYGGYPSYPTVPQNRRSSSEQPEEEPIRTSSPHGVNNQPGVMQPYDPNFKPGFTNPFYPNEAGIPSNENMPVYPTQPYYGQQWPLNMRPIVPETTDRGSQVALDMLPLDSSQLNKSPHQINSNIDVHVRNDNEPGRNNEFNNMNDSMPPYNTGNNTYQNSAPSDNIGFISPITATKQAVPSATQKPRNKKTQTADNETSNNSHISLNSSSNTQNQSRDSNSMYLIEYRYLPGLRDDPTIEDLELKCSKALGEVNGLLSAVDQISPPSSPISRTKFDHTKPKNNIVSISTVSRVRHPSYNRKSSDNLLEESPGSELRPYIPRKTGHRSLPRSGFDDTDPTSSRYQNPYPNLNTSNHSDLDPENYRSSQRLRLQNATNPNSNLLRNASLSNSLRNLNISVNKALLDQQAGHNLYRQPDFNLNSLENISNFPISSQPAYNLTEFKFSNDDLDRDYLTCECPDENRPPLGNPRPFNTRPFQRTGSHAMLPHSNYAPNLYQDGNYPMSRYSLHRSTFNPDFNNDLLCSCDDDAPPTRNPNLYTTRRYNLPQNSYLTSNTRSPDYFVRSKLTKTPFYRQPSQPPGKVNDPDCCTCSDNEDGQHFSNCPLCVIENEGLGPHRHNGTLTADPFCTCEME